MSKQIIESGVEVRKKLQKGIDKLADAVTCTLGPSGRNVILNNGGQITSTKDGVSIAKQISSVEDPIEELGIALVKQAAIKTADNAGDGTTTSTLLAQSIIKQGMVLLNNGVNVTELKSQIQKASQDVIKYLKNEIKEDISNESQLKQIATISANNDSEVGELIATAMRKVGTEGVVYIEESRSGDTYLETVEGMQFDRGYKSPYFVTDNNNMSVSLEEPLILIADKKFNQIKELLPILEDVSTQNKSLLIIAEDVEGEALATLVVNKSRGIIKVCAVKSPDFGDRRKLLLEDIAIMTGGTVFSPEKGHKLDKFDRSWFGQARVININKDQTTIVDGRGSEDAIKLRIEELVSQIEKASSPYEKEKLQERLAKFSGGVAIVHVGGFTEAEMKEKKDRVDDALQATKAALEEGIVPGGGSALLKSRKGIKDKNPGSDIIFNACSSPFKKILENAGLENEKIFELMGKISKGGNWDGYNLTTDKITNMKSTGIIDPARVTRVALENAVSVACTILLTEAVVVDKPEEKTQSSPMDMMGGMY